MQTWPRVGWRFGKEKLRQLKEALEQNTFFYIYGEKTRWLCSKMARMCGAKHMLACRSGSAAGRFGTSAQQSRAGEELHE
jgi:dTDP-4-amino-4,6-dideoxygalactose transaminase